MYHRFSVDFNTLRHVLKSSISLLCACSVSFPAFLASHVFISVMIPALNKHIWNQNIVRRPASSIWSGALQTHGHVSAKISCPFQLSLPDVDDIPRSVRTDRHRGNRQQRLLIWPRNEWSVGQNLQVVVRCVEHGGLREKVIVRVFWIPTHCLHGVVSWETYQKQKAGLRCDGSASSHLLSAESISATTLGFHCSDFMTVSFA